MLQEPAAFATAIQGLFQAQKQAISAGSHAGGEHLCFLGSGRPDEDSYTNMVVASFLQKHTQYVSMVFNGYRGISLNNKILLDDSIILIFYLFYLQLFMSILEKKLLLTLLIIIQKIV